MRRFGKRNPGAVFDRHRELSQSQLSPVQAIFRTRLITKFLSRNAALVVASAVALAEEGLTMTRRLRTSSLCWALGIAIPKLLYAQVLPSSAEAAPVLPRTPQGLGPFRNQK